MRVFVFHPRLQAFTYSPPYEELTTLLELDWESRAWIGRLFSMDNDVGEHWLDNDDFVDSVREEAESMGLDPDRLVLMRIDPSRMVDGRDGPCHTPELRLRFWNEVLASLDLSPEIIHDYAKSFHGKYSSPEEWAEIERRFASWTQRQSSSAGE